MKINNLFKKVILAVALGAFILPVYSEEKNTEYSFYTGKFDFSDEGKVTSLI
jgi:peptidoglycan biosynthesis protein MviN/MurJ (putative lipid II flippase)